MNKKIGAVLLLALSCTHAMAEWIKVSSTEQAMIYMDIEAAQKGGGHVMVWMLRDFSSPRNGLGGAYLSTKDLMEIDCSNRRIRRNYTSDHPQRMGGGAFVSSDHGPMSWNDIVPNTIVKRVADIACVRP